MRKIRQGFGNSPPSAGSPSRDLDGAAKGVTSRVRSSALVNDGEPASVVIGALSSSSSPPSRSSSPSPPDNVSLPEPPWRVSSPASPARLSSLLLPTSESGPAPPSSVVRPEKADASSVFPLAVAALTSSSAGRTGAGETIGLDFST